VYLSVLMLPINTVSVSDSSMDNLSSLYENKVIAPSLMRF